MAFPRRFRHIASASRKGLTCCPKTLNLLAQKVKPYWQEGLMFFCAHTTPLFSLFTPYYIIRAHARARGRMVPKTTLKPCFWNHAQFPLNSRTILAEFARKFLRNHAQILWKSRTNSAEITNKSGGNHAWFQKTHSKPFPKCLFLTPEVFVGQP